MTRASIEEKINELEDRARHAVWDFASEYERGAMFSRPLFCTSRVGDLPLSYDLWPILNSSLDSGTYYASHLNFRVEIGVKTTKPLSFYKIFVVEYSRAFPLKDAESPELEEKLSDIISGLKDQVKKLSPPKSPIKVEYSALEEYEECRKIQITQQIPATNYFVPKSVSWKEFASFLGFRFDKKIYNLFDKHQK